MGLRGLQEVSGSENHTWTVLEHNFEFVLAVLIEDYKNHSFGWDSRNSQDTSNGL